MHMPPMTCCLFDLFFDSPSPCHIQQPIYQAYPTTTPPPPAPHTYAQLCTTLCECVRVRSFFFAFTFFGGRKMFKNKTKMRPHYVRHPHNPTYTSTGDCPVPCATHGKGHGRGPGERTGPGPGPEPEPQQHSRHSGPEIHRNL